MVNLLVERGAARTLKDNDGRTALDLAADNAVREKLRAITR